MNSTFRIAFAGFNLESVSFLPQETTVEQFEEVAYRGQALLDMYRGTNTVAGGVIDICEKNNIDILPVVHTLLGALGPTSDKAVEFYCAEIVNSISSHIHELDGIILFLHGACWAPSYHDPERYIIDQVRKVVGPDKPIMVAMDYHANIDDLTLANATAAFTYRKSPHTDTGDTGRRTATCMLKTLQGEIQPVWAVVKPNILIPSIFSATNLHPLSDIIEAGHQIQNHCNSYMDISIMGGFSYADAENTGMGVLCVTDNNIKLAQDTAQVLSDLLAKNKEKIYRPLPTFGIDEAIDLTRDKLKQRQSDKPFVLLEHADRMNDSTYVLAALLKGNVKNVAVPFLWDRASAKRAEQAGIGQTVHLDLGGHSSDKAGPVLSVDAKVLWVGQKKFKVSGAYMRGSPINLGLTALVDINGICVSIVSEFAYAVDDDPFTIFDLKLNDFDIVLLRSKTHFRAFYETAAEEIFIVDTPDYGVADLTTLPYQFVDTTSNYPFNS